MCVGDFRSATLMVEPTLSYAKLISRHRIRNCCLITNCANKLFTMADMSMNIITPRKMSFGINGKLNGLESKTPFLIGVSGGTASGKVSNKSLPFSKTRINSTCRFSIPNFCDTT